MEASRSARCTLHEGAMTTRPDEALHAAPVVDVFDGVATVFAGDTLLALWSAPARDARIRHVSARTTALIAQHPMGIAAAQILLPSASPPGLSEVGAVREAMRVVLPKARRLVTVPLGDARWQSAVRGVMRAGLMMVGQSRLVKVVATPEEALTLLVDSGTAATPGRDSLTASLASLFAALGEHWHGVSA
jgi:hypothetical protein